MTVSMRQRMQSKYEPNREDFRCFSAIKKYVGFWMGKISCQQAPLEISDSSYGQVNVRKCRKNFVILELPKEEYILTVTLFRPEQNSKTLRTGESAKRLQIAKWKDLRWTEMGRRVFTTEEILDFVTSIQDENEIHRTATPVVPGFQMLEWLLEVLSDDDWRTWEISFHVSVLAGQELCLYPCTEGYQCILAETGELLWNCRVEQTEVK